MSRVVSVLRFGSRLLRSRVFHAVLVVAALLWAFDKGVFLATQRSFFASVGLESWFWRQLWAPVELFTAFLLICLFSTRLGLGRAAPGDSEEMPPLRGILSRFAPLRTRIAAVSRALAVVLALVLARDFARHGEQWILLRAGGRAGFGYLGFDAALWTRFLPLWMPFLLALWKFALALSFLIAVTGVLRALPSLAAHNTAPLALSRALWRTGAWLLALRALLYVSQILDLPRGKPLSSGDVLVLAPLWAVGALWCAILSARFGLRALQKTAPFPARDKPLRATSVGLAALFLPAVLGAVSYPLRAILPETVALRRERERATRAAWRLPEASIAPLAAGNAAPIERQWPVWDEAALLASRPRAGFVRERVVAWKSATLHFENGAWSALLVGESVGAQAWNSSREADVSNALALEKVDLGAAQDTSKGTPLPSPGAVFGLEGRSLFGKSGGIEVSSPGLKWAWAWRLRDLFLPVDAATAPHLLTFRGARERAQMLAPSLSIVSEPRLHLKNGDWIWTLDLCALSPNFPGAMRGKNGEWARANAILSPVQMRLDARSGAVAFMAPPGANNGLERAWRAAHPEVLPEKSPRNDPSSGALGRAQMEIFAALRSQERAIYGPMRALGARGQSVWRVLSVGKNDFELLEGETSGPVLRRGAGDLNARLSAIDAALAKSGAAQSETLDVRGGEPFVWRDARAPGGFWLGRAFFAAPRENGSPTDNSRENAPHGPLLWRVALGGVAANARIGIGDSAREAWREATGESAPANASLKPPLNLVAPQKTPQTFAASDAPLEVRALRTHEELQAAAKRGDWKAFGTLAARETALLQRLAARRQNPTRTPNP